MWIHRSFQITDFITPTSNMRLIVQIADWQADGGNLAEGGLDNFEITDGTNSISGISEKKQTLLYPNPNDGNFKLVSDEEMRNISIIDITGRIIFSNVISGNEYDFRGHTNLSDGIYHLKIEMQNDSVEIQKIIIRR
jgi:hypothetical protein